MKCISYDNDFIVVLVNGSNIVTVTMIGAVSAHYDIIVASIPVLLDQLSSVSLGMADYIARICSN